MTFPRQQEPSTIEEHLALLPPGLREFVRRETEAGNTIVRAGTGFPAAPVGVWIKMSSPFRSDLRHLPEGTVHRDRPHWTWSAECTDPPRHSFVLAKALPVPPEYRPKPVFHPTPVSAPPTIPFSGMENVDKWSDDLRVSESIARHLGLMWSPEIEAAIRAEVGESGLARVREIDEFANRAEVWTVGNHDRNYQRIQRELADRFPFLSPAAIQRLATRAAWSWR
jgi:hypothetical protein